MRYSTLQLALISSVYFKFFIFDKLLLLLMKWYYLMVMFILEQYIILLMYLFLIKNFKKNKNVQSKAFDQNKTK